VVRRELHALILALAGGTLLRLALTGGYTRYVKVGLRPYLIAAGAVLLLVALASLAQTLHSRHAGSGPARQHDDSDDHHGHDHGHAHRRRGFDVAWLLVAPMLAILLIAPPALGSFSAARSGTALGAAQTSNLAPLPTGDPVRLSVLDYASRAVFDQGRSLTGRQITLSGFVVADGAGWYLTRMVITCCAADAQPIKVGLAGEIPDGLHANDWIEVTGRYSSQTDKDAVNGQSIPYLAVASAKPIPAPAQQYVS
jgi:putative membrane protein